MTSIKYAALLTLGLLTACGVSPTDSAPDPTPSSVAATPSQELTAQGFLPKKLGEVSGTGCTVGIDTCTVKFTIDKIDVNPPCWQYGTPPATGRKTLLLHVSLTIGDASADQQFGAVMIFNPFGLKGLSADGFVHDAQMSSCTDYKDKLSHTMFPNAKYTGTVEVDVPASTVSVASAQMSDRDGNRGWVWPIG